MIGASYYRRQADICLRLALLSDDVEVVELLIAKAKELRAKAESTESGGGKNLAGAADVRLANS
jgi:hypothetical protein